MTITKLYKAHAILMAARSDQDSSELILTIQHLEKLIKNMETGSKI